MAIDPFDEFEFKPLTEGLGFHKNPESSKINTASASVSMANMNLNEPAPSKGFPNIKRPRIEFALNNPSTDIISEPAIVNKKGPAQPATSTVDEILKTLGERKKYDFTEDLKFTQNTEITLKPSYFEIAAGMLDGMLIVASFLTSLIVLLLVTKVDLFGNLLTPDEDGMVYMGLVGLFATLCWIYLVVNRMFLGYTPGEWVFDQRIGNLEQYGTASYSIRVVLRSTIVIATGMVLMPLISMVTRTDILGKLLRVQTMKKA